MDNNLEKLVDKLCDEIRAGKLGYYEIQDIKQRITWAQDEGEKVRFADHLKDAERRVSLWPPWKRNLLSNSPTNSTPRKPIVNDD